MSSLGQFFDILKHLAQWQVLLDIAIFALGIFFLTRALRATGTWKIAVGVIVAGVLAAVASLLGLRGVEWIFFNLSQFALIVLIVIFQPEIRKVLERTTFLLGSQSHRVRQEIGHLIEETLFELASRKWGAIIVLPGKDPLEQWVTEGVQVDAIPSFPLLMSIFDPTSPGHDGAVIVEQGRVARIGVHLPLSQSARLSDAYGTRHHASMGLAEKTDSMVLTVSEERGKISIFHNGVMTPVREHGDVSAHLQNFFQMRGLAGSSGGKAGRKRTRPAFADIAFSLVAAVLFWTLVIMGKTENQEMIFSVPIQYSGLQKNLILEGNVPSEVKLHLVGASSQLSALDFSRLRVQVDLAEVGEGEQVVALDEKNVIVPKRVEVVDINPSSLRIAVKELHEATLPIVPQLIGKVPEGMKVKSVRIIPDKVRVLMPEGSENFQEPRSLLTTPIYLHGLKENATVFCKIVVPSGVQNPERRWPDVEVQLSVTPEKR